MTILIAGGGIGGISAALALAQKGFKVRVLERAPEFGEIGFGIQLGPNAFEMLERLGVREALEATAFFPNNLVMQDATNGREVSRIHLKGAFRHQYKWPYAVIHRRDLHGALLDACRDKPELVSLETSSGLKSFRQDGGRVQVTLDDGREVEGEMLICADGLRSAGRQQIIGDGEPRVSGHVAHRGVVPMDKVSDTRFVDDMVIWVGPNLHLVQYRLRGGTVLNNVCVIESEEYKQGRADWGSMDEVRRIFSGMVPYVRDALGFISTERSWVMCDREPTAGWTQGNVTLLGDAAHPTLQYLAQGACMAMEDGVVLAAKMAARNGAPVNQTLQSYEDARYLRAARITLTSRFFGHVCHAGGGARDLRNHLAGQRGPENFFEVDWIYRGIEV
ncbi:MAG TPA: FAD-dependent monooxygenase [Burkholderiales bacterium]|jgi:salicylate hydroxylase|nr:FAD-dependent monooxygenase [Burkholderiales bacterium]